MKDTKVVVAIDGPAGSGKTTVARMVAKELGYILVDTGAIYRCLALLARREGVSDSVGKGLRLLAEGMNIRFEEGQEKQRVWLNDEEVTEEIREPEISSGASRVSVHPEVREALLGIQRKLGSQGGVVMEGRDIGTVVFPDALAKFFLKAPDEVRAKRRYDELVAKGMSVDLDQVLVEVKKRDDRDQSRSVAPLVAADDAKIIETGPLTIEQVVAQVVQTVKQKTA
jgi:cytidylate kinase